MKNLIVILTVLCSSAFGFAQSSAAQKREALITSKKWTCLDMTRKKLENTDFRFEIGNNLKFEIDKKYQFENNLYNHYSGQWKLDKKKIYFFYVDPNGTNQKITATYKVLKLSSTKLKLKRLDKPRRKIVLK